MSHKEGKKEIKINEKNQTIHLAGRRQVLVLVQVYSMRENGSLFVCLLGICFAWFVISNRAVSCESVEQSTL